MNTAILTVRLPRSMLTALHSFARKQGISTSALIRLLILNRHLLGPYKGEAS